MVPEMMKIRSLSLARLFYDTGLLLVRCSMGTYRVAVWLAMVLVRKLCRRGSACWMPSHGNID